MNRSSDALRFTRLRYRARDPESLARFYDDTLGVAELLQFVPATADPDSHGAGLFHTAFVFPDRTALAATLLRLGALGVRIDGASDHDVSEAVYLTDPEGNGIEVYCDRPADTWRFDGERIRMGTRPLDLADLLAQAPAPPYDVPVGARVGHVHLRALDLATAERFWVDRVRLDLTLRYGDAASFLAAGGYHHHVGINRFAPWSRRVAGAPGLAAIEMDMRDAGERLELVTPEGVEVTVRPTAG